jgi:predicted nucleotidyltransferase
MLNPDTCEMIKGRLDRISGLCSECGVELLAIFGSAVCGDFNDASDVDVYVRFRNMDPAEYSDCYFNLIERLEAVFQKRADLVDAAALENPYIEKQIFSTMEIIYEAA